MIIIREIEKVDELQTTSSIGVAPMNNRGVITLGYGVKDLVNDEDSIEYELTHYINSRIK